MAIKSFFLSLSSLLSFLRSLLSLLAPLRPSLFFHSLTCLLNTCTHTQNPHAQATHTHTHSFFFITRALSLSLLFNLLTLLLARLSQHPPCCPSSFILFLLPPSLPPSAFFSLSLSHTHIYILTQTDTRTHSHTPIYIFQLHLWQVVISTVRNCFFNISLSNYEPS